MNTETKRFDLRLPAEFRYDDHPYIDHLLSDFLITPDTEEGGWKVCKPLPTGRLQDICYYQSVDDCFDFVGMVTYTVPTRFHDRQDYNYSFARLDQRRSFTPHDKGARRY